jgi:hypothetical protein
MNGQTCNQASERIGCVVMIVVVLVACALWATARTSQLTAISECMGAETSQLAYAECAKKVRR